MVVSAADGHYRAGCVAPDRTYRHDGALAGHQARNRGRGAHGPGVGQREAGPGQVVGREAAGSSTAHQVVVAAHEVGEIKFAGPAHDGHDEKRLAVSADHVHRQSQVDLGGLHSMGSPIDLREVGAERRMNGGSLGNGVGDDVRQRQPGGRDSGVQLLSAGHQSLDRDLAEGGRGRYCQARGHVGHETRSDSLDRHRAGRSRLANCPLVRHRWRVGDTPAIT